MADKAVKNTFHIQLNTENIEGRRAAYVLQGIKFKGQYIAHAICEYESKIKPYETLGVEQQPVVASLPVSTVTEPVKAEVEQKSTYESEEGHPELNQYIDAFLE